MRPGDTPSVLAMSWGKGDPQKDAITLVLLDEAGRLREHTKIDNLVDNELKTEFLDLLRHRKPDVIVIGGLTMATTKLSVRIKEVLRGEPAAQGENGAGVTWGSETRDANEQVFDIPVIYVLDDVARLYRNSKQAAEEFSALSPTAKYCVGLARYTQSLLNEYAALGADITAISFDEEDQLLVGLGAEIISNNSHLCRCRQKGCCSRWNEPLLT
jgi:transcription elongation factor SPT6